MFFYKLFVILKDVLFENVIEKQELDKNIQTTTFGLTNMTQDNI